MTFLLNLDSPFYIFLKQNFDSVFETPDLNKYSTLSSSGLFSFDLFRKDYLILPENLCYGNLLVVKAFYGVHPSVMLNIPHGLSYSGVVHKSQLIGQFILVYSISTYMSLLAHSRHNRLTPLPIPSKSPYSCALQLYYHFCKTLSVYPPNIPNSALVFLNKSTSDSTLRHDQSREVINLVNQLRSQYDQVNCVYFWKDKHRFRPLIKRYFDHSYCAGAQYDPFFLLRLSRYISQHTHVFPLVLGNVMNYAYLSERLDLKSPFLLLSQPWTRDMHLSTDTRSVSEHQCIAENYHQVLLSSLRAQDYDSTRRILQERTTFNEVTSLPDFESDFTLWRFILLKSYNYLRQFYLSN